MSKLLARSPGPALRDTTRREVMLVAGREVPVVLRANKRARRVILRVNPVSGEVLVTSPSVRGFARALAFAREHEAWIAERLETCHEPVPFVAGAMIPVRGEMHEIVHAGPGRRPVYIDNPVAASDESGDLPLFAVSESAPRLCVSGDEAHLSRRVTDWLKKEARKDLTDATFAHAEALGVRPSRISIRDTASRWGSCSTTRAISYSWRLIFAPPFALDYVAAHEVAHLIEHNHGRRFWKLVESRVVDIEGAKAWLAANGQALHRYGAGPT